MARVKTRAEQKDATRARLLAVARRVFSQHGYEATSIALVCRAARVTHGALYHHFQSKDVLFAAVVAEVFNEVGARVLAALQGHLGWAQVEATCDAYLQACTDPEVQLFVFRDGPRVLPRETFDAIDHAVNAPLVEGLITGWIAQGLFQPRPVSLLARTLGAAFAEAGLAIQQAPNAERTHVQTQVAALLRSWVASLRRSSLVGPTPIATERLVLRPWGAADVPDLLRLTAEPHVYAYLFDGTPPTVEWMSETIASSTRALEQGDLGLWLACEGSGEAVGIAGFVRGEGSLYELAVAVRSASTNRGYAGEMAKAVLREARARQRSPIAATVDSGNSASVRLLEKLGFVKAGRRDGPLGEIAEYVLPFGAGEC